MNNIKNPSHYKFGNIETIDYIKAVTSDKRGFEAVCVANIIKYVSRYDKKNGVEDLKKANVYLDWLIEEMTCKAGRLNQITLESQMNTSKRGNDVREDKTNDEITFDEFLRVLSKIHFQGRLAIDTYTQLQKAGVNVQKCVESITRGWFTSSTRKLSAKDWVSKGEISSEDFFKALLERCKVKEGDE